MTPRYMLNLKHVLLKYCTKSGPIFLKIHQIFFSDFIGAFISVDMGMSLRMGIDYSVSVILLWPQSCSQIQKSANYYHRNRGFLYAVQIYNPLSSLVES